MFTKDTAIWLSILGCIIFLFAGGFILYKNQLHLYDQWKYLQQEHLFSHPESITASPAVIERVVTSGQLWRPIQDRIRDTVVQIFTQASVVDLLEPYKAPAQATVCGSGFFINAEGYIITNAHVVNQAKIVWIQLPTLGKIIIDVELVGMSPERDLALLKVTQEGYATIVKALGAIPFLPLGDSDLVRRSDDVLALGYPLGQQSFKSTTGVISGYEQHLIQISAPINPGSSGGPLLNTKGEVIGVNSSGIIEAQNVGYAIPINTLKTILHDLYHVKLLRKPFLGVRFNNSSDALTKFLSNPLPGGCYVIDVVKGSTLDRAGVMGGDMIYEINGHSVDMYGEMNVPWSEDKVSIIDYPLRLSIGDTISLVIYRRGDRKEFKVVFDHATLPAIRRIYPGYDEIDYEIFGGMVVQELSLNHVHLLAEHVPGLVRYSEMKYQTEPVLIITHIFRDSQLFRARNLQIGTTINEINGAKVKTLADLREVLQKSATREFLTIVASDNITRTTDNVFVVLEMEKLIEEEARLSRDYHYPLTDTAKEILRIAHTQKQFETIVTEHSASKMV